MATVWKDTRSADPRWCIKYKSIDGRWRRERTDARTKEEAQALLGRKLQDLATAKIIGAPSEDQLARRTFRKFVEDEYLKHCELHHKASTLAGDREYARVVAEHFGARELRAIAQGDVIRWLEKLAHGRAPATVNRYRTWLSGVFSEAMRRGYVGANPVRGIRKLREPAARIRYLSIDEERRLLAECPPWLAVVVRVALLTGMRRGELLRLQWRDVNLDRRQIHVRETKADKDRFLPVNVTLGQLLEVHRGLAGEEASVFTWPDGGEGGRRRSESEDPTSSGMRAAFKAALRGARVERFRFHDLRHTFASRLVQAGISLQVVKELLGHSTLAMVLRYAHLAPANLEAAVAVLDEVAQRAVENGTPVVQRRAAR